MADPSSLGGSTRHQIPEDCVEYMLFLVERQDADRRAQLSRLDELRKAALALMKDIASDHIWQRDEFALDVKSDQGLVFLHGLVNYGDSVEDEWLIVYVLRELTRANPALWVRVSDGDGEFLLVEAANTLPGWLNPEMDRHRPWIHGGKLYIIPLDRQANPQSRTISLPESVAFIRTQPSALVQSDLIESEAFYRLDKYPSHVAKSLHRALLTIPRKLAYILHERPKSISPATEAFYLRDAIAMKPILSASSRLRFPPKDLVTISVTFTRVLYAQLRSQRFESPPRWVDAMAGARDEETRFRLEMGLKLTCGYEIMVQGLDKTNNRVAREVGIILDDAEEDGDAALPTDSDISQWKDSTREDDDSWLDINYEDFERELDGKSRHVPNEREGFGDAATQADLQKMVSRFESFLNDESAGIDGAEMDDMDYDNDTDSEDSEDEDKAVSFDGEAFARMMREMMGLPADAPGDDGKPAPALGASSSAAAVTSADDDQEDITSLVAQMEAELNEHGALQLDPTPRKLAALKGKGKEEPSVRENEDEESESEGEIDIDYNLAKNLLESFKSQGGMAGPAGNMLGLMGMRLPRDEGDEDGENNIREA